MVMSGLTAMSSAAQQIYFIVFSRSGCVRCSELLGIARIASPLDSSDRNKAPRFGAILVSIKVAADPHRPKPSFHQSVLEFLS